MTAAFTGSWRRVVALAVLLGFVPATSACFGSFQLTRKVYQFNRSVSPDKWIRWLAFLAMIILPIYEFATLLDALFANSVEFWTGRNPITAKLEPRTLVGPNGEVASLVPVDGGARLVLTEPSGAVHTMTLLREAPGVVAAYDAAGTLVHRVVGFGTEAPRLVAAR